jgi:hypothetical protein
MIKEPAAEDELPLNHQSAISNFPPPASRNLPEY